MASLKVKQLEQYLQELELFKAPKIKLEQYTTMPHIATRILHTIQSSFGDIQEKLVCDLGCGCGTLAIGSALLGAQSIVGVDIDDEALLISKDNVKRFELTNVDFVRCDVFNIPDRFLKFFDTVIMNPPFGTNKKGIDMEFLATALKMATTAVYSLHKTTTRNHVLRKAKDWKVKAQVVAELRFDLPSAYKFHKKETRDIEVDFIRFSF